jgi:hypothetical protein
MGSDQIFIFRVTLFPNTVLKSLIVRAHAYGTPGPALQTVITQLRHAGLALGTPAPAHGATHPSLLMVVVRPAAAEAPGAAALFLAAEDAGPLPSIAYPLIPAVQRVREAAHHATRGGALGLVPVQEPGRSRADVPHDQLAPNFTRVDMR